MRKFPKYSSLLPILLLVSALCIYSNLIAQKSLYFPPIPKDTSAKKKIEILKTDSLTFQTLELGTYRKLIGHVQLRHENAKMFCDSAIIDIEANYLTAYGKQVHIQKGDSIDVWGNFLEYFGDQKLGRLTGMCSMRDKTMILTSPELNYNTETDVGSYMSGGRIVNKETIITSAIGYYYHQQNTALFYGDVVLKDKERTIYADSMRYNTEKEIAYFITKTTIIDKDSNIIVTNSGYYDTKNEKAFFGNNTEIKKGDASVKAETIDYDNKTKIAIAKNNVVLQDSSERTTILSNYIYSDENKSYMLAYKDPLMISVSEDTKDTLYLSADTLLNYKIAATDSLSLNDSISGNDSIKITQAWRHMKLIQGEMSAVADSMFYSEKDSIFKMYYTPILWMDSTQITGDSIYLFNRNNSIYKIAIYHNAFIINLQDPDVYNQTKGKWMEAFIENKKIDKVEVDGNAESIYFIKEKDAYNGANKSTSAFITVSFKDGDVNRIKLTGMPDAEFTPMKKINVSSFRLDGFKWYGDKQPRSKYDIIRDKKQYEKYVAGLPVKNVKIVENKEMELKAD
ncbi:MAG: OstA-like protein [Chitinophagales bacterium]